MFSNCVVFAAAPLGNMPRKLLESAQGALVIAVDGGLKHLEEIKLIPSLWVGDGDSCSIAHVKAARKRAGKNAFAMAVLSVEKDYSDFEYALHLAGEAYVEGAWRGELVVFGGQGGRFDHEFANLQAINFWLQELAETISANKCPNVVSLGDKGRLICSVNEVHFDLKKGEVFSVFPLSAQQRISITGAKYNVRAKQFTHASTGLSNEAAAGEVCVKAQIKSSGARPIAFFVMIPAQ